MGDASWAPVWREDRGHLPEHPFEGGATPPRGAHHAAGAEIKQPVFEGRDAPGLYAPDIYRGKCGCALHHHPPGILLGLVLIFLVCSWCIAISSTGGRRAPGVHAPADETQETSPRPPRHRCPGEIVYDARTTPAWTTMRAGAAP
jgi:hypothetical protein